MIGIKDPWILGAYLACVLSAILCVIYGLRNWNLGANNEEKEILEEVSWEKDEHEVESKL